MGGAERSLLDCIASVRAAEPWWQLHVIAGEDGPLLAEARALGAHAHCLPFPARLSRLGSSGASIGDTAWKSLIASPSIANYSRRLHQAIGNLAPDVIHTNGMKMHLLAARESKIPVVWHMHDYLGSRPTVARALRLSSKHVGGILATSRSVKNDVLQLLGTDLRVETMLNGVDVDRFRPRGPKLDLDQLSGLPPAISGTVRIGLVGTFARWKGHEVFLRAMAEPRFRNALVRPYIIGGPIYRTPDSQFSLQELRSTAGKLGIGDSVGFTGFVSDSAAAMRSLDIVVHASTEPEPFGLVIAEGMASGRIVIASNAGGAAELVCNERDGISITPGDPRILANSVHQLLLDPVKRMCLASAARTTAEARFDRARLGPTLSSFYGKILDRAACVSSTSTAEIGTAA